MVTTCKQTYLKRVCVPQARSKTTSFKNGRGEESSITNTKIDGRLVAVKVVTHRKGGKVEYDYRVEPTT